MCVTGDTRLQTSLGWVRVADLLSDLLTQDNCLNHELSVMSGSGHGSIYLRDVSCRNQMVIRVTTSRGHWMDVTQDHPFLVVDRYGNLTFRTTRRFRAGDWLCRQGGVGQFGTDIKLPTAAVRPRTNYKRFKLPDTFDRDWAAFLGLYLAEGARNLAKNRVDWDGFQLSLAHEQDPELPRKSGLLLRAIFGERLSEQTVHYDVYQDQTRFSVSSVDIGAWLAKYAPGNSHNKRMPEFVFHWPKHLQSTLLQWLFAHDGTVKCCGNGHAIQYSTASEHLARSIALLLINFGISTTVRSETRANYQGTYWVVELFSNAARQTFARDIGFVTTTAKTTACRVGRYFCDHRPIPNQVGRLFALLPYVPGQVKEKCRECIRKNARIKLNPTRLSQILKSVDYVGLPRKIALAYDHLADLLRREISFEQIATLENRGRHLVYNVKTKDDECHVINYDGFLTG